ncbi:uncharacterized protein LOC122654894 [Telopea speciosissima]|uniref:uncharacterized protein LOC122654894 n=1 Tax=Telopea speciosissima TaxID=54955 RepID=UPI001CC39268|nr:uncharacterized protein LOC122654894 [Telopea speciosissima]
MKTQHPKLKTPPRPLFSCGFFRYCTQTVVSPTTPITPTLPQPPPPPPPPLPPATDTLPSQSHPESESSSSSSSTSQSFTQWRKVLKLVIVYTILPLQISMKTQHPKLKTPPRPLFSCGFFRYCTQTVLSPTTPITPTLPQPPPPPPPLLPPATDTLPSRPHPESESSSSSSSTSQSFTQWRFPLPQSPIFHHQPTPQLEFLSQLPRESTSSDLPPLPPPSAVLSSNLAELFHVAELQFSTGSDADRLSALHLLEHSLVAKPATEGGGDRACPPAVMNGVVSFLKDPAEAKSATKVLLALCLAEGNRHVAVEAGAVAEVVETVAGLEGSAAERALAALDLLCTLPEGAAELRTHALAVPMLVEMMGKVAGRGKECAISVLAVIFGGGSGNGNEGVPVAQSEDVRRTVVVALQGKCSARGRRKGSQLLKLLHLHDNDENGRLDFTEEGQ